MPDKIGDTRTIVETYMRHECECCGKPAVKRHSFLLDGARYNSASTAFGKDDISWCADDEAFICSDCPEPKREGMNWTASFSGERFSHMLHFWHEVSRDIQPADVAA